MFHSSFSVFRRHNATKEERFQIESIEKVFNPILLHLFEQKREQYLWLYGKVNVVQAFHGTKISNIPSILERNLEVSRHGRSTGMLNT